jgi:microcystin-dependent protein
MADGYGRHTPALAGSRIARVLVFDQALAPFIGDAITALTNASEWLEVGDPVDDIITAAFEAVDSYYENPMIGLVASFLTELPQGWLPLDGSTYSAEFYPELYALLDAQFKDEPNEEFTLPDMTDLFLVGAGSTYGLGDQGGENYHTLTTAEMPSHTHTYTPPVFNIDLEAPGAPDILAAGIGTPTATGSAGSGDQHENRPPYIAVTYAIFAGR